MKTFTTVYKNETELVKFIGESNITHHRGEILVQIFNSKNDKSHINNVVKQIKNILVHAKIIGTSTCGEICEKGMLENSCVLSFSLFDSTSVKTIFKQNVSNPFETGQDIAKELLSQEDLKCVIAFSDGLHFNAEQIINGINSIKSDILVCGGISGDNSNFSQTFVFDDSGIYCQGIVLAGLYSKELFVHTDCNFNWMSIGKIHTITQSEENRVYKIDDMTPVEFYKHYLGDDLEQFLPNIGIEFPLIIQNEKLPVARAVLQKFDDDSLGFAGSLKIGTPIKFGYGDIEMILNHSKDMADKINNHIPIESIFIYSCIARKNLLKKDVNMEILPLRNIAKMSGFFTYGEFFNHNGKNYLLNETMTILTLSETLKTTPRTNDFKANLRTIDSEFIRKKALSNLIAQTSKELETLQNELKKEVQRELQKSIEKDNLIKLNSRQALLGEMIEMILHQWRQPLSTFALATSTLQLFKETGQLSDTMFEKHTDIMMNNVHFLNETITIFRDFFNPDKIIKKTKPSAIVHKVSILLAPLLKQYTNLLKVSIDDDDCFFVDENELVQVLLNLIKNAIDEFDHKKPQEPNIEIRFSNHESYIHIEVEDNAGGIEESILSKIFDKKFTTKSNQGGTGLGLHMSKDIIEKNLGGKIFALNGTYGAIFKLKIPIK